MMSCRESGVFTHSFDVWNEKRGIIFVKGAVKPVGRALVTDWVEEIVQDSDIELVDVEYVKEHTGWILRVFLVLISKIARV